MEMPEMPPVPESSNTIEEVLADLAGAIFAALDIKLEQNPDEKLSEAWLVIMLALKQFENSGFFLNESRLRAINILESYEAYKRL